MLPHLCIQNPEFRNKFAKSVIIDIVSYRRYGHNEGDEPRFTQPKMYKTVDQKDKLFFVYGQSLIESGVCTQKEFETKINDFKDVLESELAGLDYKEVLLLRTFGSYIKQICFNYSPAKNLSCAQLKFFDNYLEKDNNQ